MIRSISVIRILSLFLVLTIFVQPAAASIPLTPQAAQGYFTAGSASFNTPGRVSSLLELNDGRVLIAGSFTRIANQAAPRSLAIMQSDGSLDTSFQVEAALEVNEVTAAAIQPDGKILIAGLFKILPGPFTYFLLRLNANGTIDDTFENYDLNSNVYTVLLDGNQIVVGGSFTQPTPYLARLNQNGSTDTTFNGMGSGPDGDVRDIAIQQSGKYIIAGDFASYNGIDQAGVARLNANGSLDAAFATGGFRASEQVAVLNDGSVVVGGTNICGDDLFAWYSAEGAAKPALSTDPNTLQSITALSPLPDGGFLIGGWYSAVCINNSPTRHEGNVWRYAADGTYQTMTSFGDESDVLALALRSDGALLVGGRGWPGTIDEAGLLDGLALFDLSNDGLYRVEAFHPLVGDEAEVFSLSRYADGKVLVAGTFSHVDGHPRYGLARLLSNGQLDLSFAPFAGLPRGWSFAALALPDGRAIAGFASSNLYLVGLDGSLTDLSAINNYDRVSALAYQNGQVLVGSDFGTGVKRLNADFSGLDATFTIGEAYGNVYALAVQADNKIFVAGDFSQYNGETYPGLVRLNSNGTIDGSFTPPVFMLDEYNTATLYSVFPLASGKVLVGGNFTLVGGAEHMALVRLDGSGALDATFSSPANFHTVKAIGVQADGSIWIGGIDNTFFRQPLVSHLDENGLVDATFQSVYLGAHSGGSVNALLCNADGLAWASGRFSLIDGRPFSGPVQYFVLRGQIFLPLIGR
ncbi:MAG TPA: delta-60 repeat domain-containing protein [Anaerolineales bacterium]|nr:delta-60 repeat domain-containing protein [Anaerolineales bacterium]